MNFTVSTDLFRGPVDLLLFLVRRHELELAEISLSSIAQQFIDYLEVLKEIEIDTVGDFIEVASVLVEMKSKAVLPRTDDDEETVFVDPRQDLVQRLLLYKKFKDAAVELEERSHQWQHRYSRIADDIPTQKIDYADQPITDIELWDLVSAFGRVLRDSVPKIEENIVYDETPIQVYMHRIHRQVAQDRKVAFNSLFQQGMHKSAMVGVFLAVLELTRHHNVYAQQSGLHTDILILPGDGFKDDAEFHDVDNYGQSNTPAGDPASLVE
ncbi:MAG: segregation/condensation protein A [Planctomycetota bacterium]